MPGCPQRHPRCAQNPPRLPEAWDIDSGQFWKNPFFLFVRPDPSGPFRRPPACWRPAGGVQRPAREVGACMDVWGGFLLTPAWALGPWDPGPWDPGSWDPGPWDPGPWDPGPWDPGPWDPGPHGTQAHGTLAHMGPRPMGPRPMGPWPMGPWPMGPRPMGPRPMGLGPGSPAWGRAQGPRPGAGPRVPGLGPVSYTHLTLPTKRIV